MQILETNIQLNTSQREHSSASPVSKDKMPSMTIVIPATSISGLSQCEDAGCTYISVSPDFDGASSVYRVNLPTQAIIDLSSIARLAKGSEHAVDLTDAAVAKFTDTPRL